MPLDAPEPCGLGGDLWAGLPARRCIDVGAFESQPYRTVAKCCEGTVCPSPVTRPQWQALPHRSWNFCWLNGLLTCRFPQWRTFSRTCCRSMDTLHCLPLIVAPLNL